MPPSWLYWCHDGGAGMGLGVRLDWARVFHLRQETARGNSAALRTCADGVPLLRFQCFYPRGHWHGAHRNPPCPAPVIHSMQTVTVFVDVQNIYYTTRQCFSRHFDYNNFWAEVTRDRKVVKAIAFATDRDDEKQKQFQNIL